MKKELNDLLTIGSATKRLKINDAFTIESVPVDNVGNAVEVFGTQPDHMELRLIYTLAHDKCLHRQRGLVSTTAEGLMLEIPAAMAHILDGNRDDMVRAFKNGYLGG